jgi:F-type H+-transporting ATPase subunit b
MRQRLRATLTLAALLCVFAATPRLRAQDAAAAPAATAPAASTAASTAANQPAKEEAGESENEAMRHSAVVKALGHALHMQPEPAAKLFEIINFAILLGAIVYALKRKLPSAFSSRTSGIQKNLAEARTATESANIRLAAVEERLSRMDTEIATIRTQAEQDAALDEQRIKAAAEEDKQKIIAAAEQEIVAATAQAQRQIRRFAAEMVIEQATKRLQISADLDRQLIEEFAGKLLPDSKRGSEN